MFKCVVYIYIHTDLKKKIIKSLRKHTFFILFSHTHKLQSLMNVFINLRRALTHNRNIFKSKLIVIFINHIDYLEKKKNFTIFNLS